LLTKPPSGTRDFLPEDVRRREHVVSVVREVYERYGFEPLETPALENIETLLGKYGEEGNKLIFKILRRGEHEASGEADLALRYDLTVPLSRVVAEHQNALPRFFKRYQIQPVWRADRPARGRFREFYQCDIDSIGSRSPVVEAEQLAAVAEVLTTLGFDDFVIHMNHRKLLTGLLEASGIDATQQTTALVALDKLDKIGPDGVSSELTARGISEESSQRLLAAVAVPDPAAGAAWLTEQGSRLGAEGRSGAENLRQVLELAGHTGTAMRVRLDPSLARGLAYYTGAIMEIRTPDSPGSLAAGGRYDTLIGSFIGRDVPACGFSLGLERILVVMTERGLFPPGVSRAAVDALVTIWNDERRGDALALASELRAAAVRAEVYPEADKLGKQFKYASARGVPFVAVVGEDEQRSATVSIKDMRSGEQTTVARGEAAAYIRSRTGGPDSEGRIPNP
jgi:histidyl-tRNA synthetase